MQMTETKAEKVIYLMCSDKWLLKTVNQGQHQGKSLGGRKKLGGLGGSAPSRVQGAEPLGGGQVPKPPVAEAFSVLKSW